MIKQIQDLVMETDEVGFLIYLIGCCENILENKKIVATFTFSPVELQLIKLRAEVTQRLEERLGVKYGKFAFNEHLFSHLSGEKAND